MNRTLLCAAISAQLGLISFVPMLHAQDPAPNSPATKSSAEPATRPAPKELSDNAKKGLAYLAGAQLNNGAWGQGDESREMGNSLAGISASPNVADTCMVAMAFYSAGSTPSSGPYKDNLVKAVDFVCDQINHANGNDLYITDLRGTRTQIKLGSYIDTFMAAQMLAELKDKMPDDAGKQKVSAALALVIKKIETNQQQNGQWASNGGWAPTLAQAQASKALNVAAQNGAAVNEQVRGRAESFARQQFKTGDTDGSAGVQLYSAGGQIAAMQASANTNEQLRDSIAQAAASPSTSPAAANEAKDELRRFDDNASDLKKAQEQVVDKMNDERFMAGFGSNGGEEFLSYLNIGESLILKGGDDWQKWDQSITANLDRIQNADGSWSGSHCITGRTFCTAAAIQVLTIDRAPAPSVKATAEAK